MPQLAVGPSFTQGTNGVLSSYESEGCFVMSAVALPDLSGAEEGSEGLCEPSSSALPPQMPSSYRLLQHQA